MRTYYVRPRRFAPYGSGDGASYENAWNGFESVRWEALLGEPPATLWVCGRPEGVQGFVTLQVELSCFHELGHRLAAARHHDPVTAEARPLPRRESAQPV